MMASKDDQELLLRRADMALKMIKDMVDFRYKVAAALIAGNLAACGAWLVILKDGKPFSNLFFFVSAGLLCFGLTTAALAIAMMYASHELAQQEVTGALASDAPPSGNAWISEALKKAKHEAIEIWFLLASLFCLLLGIGGIGDALRGQTEKITAERPVVAAPAPPHEARFSLHHDPTSRDVVFP
jgi:hypothetical protein